MHQMTRVVGALDAAPGRGSSPECPRESGEAKGGSSPALSCAAMEVEHVRCERWRVRALVKEMMEERQQLPAVGTLERMTKQLSEETKAEARRMLLLCARDGACPWGHAAQQ